MRVYVRIRGMMQLNKELLQRLDDTDRKLKEHDNHI
jgi:hypothetical protein